MTGYQSKKLMAESRAPESRDCFDYKVKVTLKCDTTGYDDIPDSCVTIEFDSTELNIDQMLDKYLDFMSSIGYVINREHDKFVYVRGK